LPGIVPTIKLGHAIREKRISHPKDAKEENKPEEIEKALPVKKPRAFFLKTAEKEAFLCFARNSDKVPPSAM
jgi:hypothetical protein